jgi:two-component system phosphate regulon sensor histidine kinase PhoR
MHQHLALIGQTIELQIAREMTRTGQPNLETACQTIAPLPGTRVTVILASGEVVCDTLEDSKQMANHRDRPEFQEALRRNTGTATRYSSTLGYNMIYLARPIVYSGEVVGAVRCAIAEAAANQELRRLQKQIGGAALGIGALASLLSYAAARRISQPLEELSQDARRVTRGEINYKVAVPEPEELAVVGNAINRLAQQLEERSDLIGRQGYEQEAVLASMVEGVLAVDPQQHVMIVNKAAAELVGGQQIDLRGKTLQEVIRNADLKDFATRAMVSDESIEADVTLRGQSERILRVRGTALRNGYGDGIGALIVLNDVTNVRRLENLRRDFVANVSHELKTPIASIKGWVETLLDGALKNPDEAERFLRIVVKQADRLNSIIEDLLSLSKIEQSEEAANLHLEEAQIRDVLEAVLADCHASAAERNIHLKLTCDPSLSASINAPLLEQAVINLVDNAIKYSDPGNEVLITVHSAGDEVRIAVVDHGCGVDQDHLPRLFERFYRVDKARSRKLGGTGLGLAIVKHIIQAHRGRITVDSAPGKGSTFTIFLSKVPTEKLLP